MSFSTLSLQSVATDVATHHVRIENCEKRQETFEKVLGGQAKEIRAVLVGVILTLIAVLVKHG